MEIFLHRFLANLILLFLAIGWGQPAAQEASKSAIKAEITLRLIEHVTWQNEDQYRNFTIAFMGGDREHFDDLEAAIVGRTIRGKGIQLTSIDAPDDLAGLNVLVVAGDTKLPFSEIALRARRSSTLVVTEVKDSQIYIMINFVLNLDQSISFEFNRPNILLEGLTISNEILLLGGAELDVAKLYREIEEDLSLLVRQLRETESKSVLANEALALSEKQLEKEHERLVFARSSFQADLDEQKRIVALQTADFAARQTDSDRQSARAGEELKSVKIQIERLAMQVTQQRKMVTDNEALLAFQQDALASQKLNLDQQTGVIRTQEQLIYITLGMLALFLVLVSILFRVNRDRRRISLELEMRRDALEEEVKDRTARFRALSELSPVGVFQTDVDGNCRYVNGRWCEYSGLTREQASGFGWLKAIHPDDRKHLGQPLDLQTEEMFNSEYRYLSPDGDVLWLLGQCEAEHDADNVLLGYIGTVTNITDQKRLQNQVRRSQKMDALGMLTGGIAHDFNNMLAIITGFAELLKSDLVGHAKRLKWVEQIAHAGARGSALTSKLMSFSRQEASDPGQVNINSLLSHEQQLLEKTLTPRINLVLSPGENLWPVWIDDGDLGDALVNMCINAVHAMEDSGTLTIRTKNVTINSAEVANLPAGDYVLVTISDTGAGMDEETREKIFDPFYSTKGAKGSGLGLTQVYGFVERSKGTIRVESNPGEGSRFLLYFPRHRELVKPSRNGGDSVVIDFRGKESVLIVDDEQALLELAANILAQEGYETTCVTTSKQALTVLEQTDIDLLLTDVVMPDMDGYQLANMVQRLYPATKIQLVSGHTDEKNRSGVDPVLMQNLLKKPYLAQELLQRIREVLDREKTTQEQRSAF